MTQALKKLLHSFEADAAYFGNRSKEEPSPDRNYSLGACMAFNVAAKWTKQEIETMKAEKPIDPIQTLIEENLEVAKDLREIDWNLEPVCRRVLNRAFAQLCLSSGVISALKYAKEQNEKS